MTGNRGQTIAPAFDGLIEHLPDRFFHSVSIWPTPVAEFYVQPGKLAVIRSLCQRRSLGLVNRQIFHNSPIRRCSPTFAIDLASVVSFIAQSFLHLLDLVLV